MNDFLLALGSAFEPYTLFLIVAATIVGVLVGALPGLSSTMAAALLLPFTIFLEPIPAIASLAALYCGGTFGGSITAILINTPGAPPAAATAFDGYPMAQRGEAGRALGIATISSAIGGIFSLIVLLVAAPFLAGLAYRFGPPEYFALTVFGLSMLASISGKNATKNLIGGCLGVFLATVGVSLTTGVERFTFGIPELYEGIDFVPVLIGMFAITELLTQAGITARPKKSMVDALRLPKLQDFKDSFATILRSCGIGTFIGILPAEGGTIASMIGYNEARRWSKRPDEFGTGIPEGIAGPETANNAATGGAMVPTLALGIPGSGTTAVILGGLIMHGLRPGPYLFQEQPTLLYGIFISMLIANVVLVVFGLLGIKLFARVTLIPPQFLWPAVFALCVVGSFGVNQSVIDVYIMLLAGCAGYMLKTFGFAPAPIIMGLVLGTMVDNTFAQSMIIFDMNWMLFFTRPIALVFFLLALFGIAGVPIINTIRRTWNGRMPQTAVED
ncbi:tripartite tricarboxylate transporter permease [Hoeflea ulvae]|uniref:Tripartite tricarboxylate transporter permease n=1 Tax=Hoeflea ulvae TaxID=2983764 RepID=A0ABT3YM75_9HYPH|nr:tripartite tricarboxylate transporter permease [Hoeflea ulvae]MCY0097000.1 tripartite tricarboxylate transporter permease [Hoeflea ulvae]